MNMYVMNSLDQFDIHGLSKAIKTLTAYRDNPLPTNWNEYKVRLDYNSTSGCVFLSNGDYQCLLLDGDKLKIWHTLMYSGREGFIDDLIHDFYYDELANLGDIKNFNIDNLSVWDKDDVEELLEDRVFTDIYETDEYKTSIEFREIVDDINEYIRKKDD